MKLIPVERHRQRLYMPASGPTKRSWFVAWGFTSLNWEYTVLLGCCLLVLINIKLTAFVYVFAALAAFGILAMVQSRRPVLKRVLGISGASVLLAVLTVGYSPFVTNVVHYRNPLYLVLGPESISLKETNVPVNYVNKSTPEILLASIFFEGDKECLPGSGLVPEGRFKWPFLVTSGDWEAVQRPASLGNFGPWLSGAFLILLVLLGLSMYRFYLALEEDEKPAGVWLNYAVFALAAIVLSCLLNFAPSTARYIPQLWLIFPVGLIFGWMLPGRSLNWLTCVLAGVCLANIALTAYANLTFHIAQTNLIQARLRALRQSSAEQTVLLNPNRMPAATEIMLREYGIEHRSGVEMAKVCKNSRYAYIPDNDAVFCLDRQRVVD